MPRGGSWREGIPDTVASRIRYMSGVYLDCLFDANEKPRLWLLKAHSATETLGAAPISALRLARVTERLLKFRKSTPCGTNLLVITVML